MLILEASERLGGEHTWSFHDSDLDSHSLEWARNFVSHRWTGYGVFFPKFVKEFDLSYSSIRCGPQVPAPWDYHHLMMPHLRTKTLFHRQAVEVGKDWVRTADGTLHEGALVIDGRGPLTPSGGRSPLRDEEGYDQKGYQKFFGLVVTTDRPHGLTRPILMDTRVTQKKGYHFVYTLPFTDKTLLIEDTYYNLSPRIDRLEMLRELISYSEMYLGLHWNEELRAGLLWEASLESSRKRDLSSNLKAQVIHIEQEESGVLDIPLSNHQPMPENQGPLRSGLRAGLFHPTTSYSLGHAVSFADFFTSIWNPRAVDDSIGHALAYQKSHWDQGRFFRRLNNMLFLAAMPEKRMNVFEHFYKKDENLIKNFYRGQMSLIDQVSLLSGRPPVPVLSAFKTFFGTRSHATRIEREHHAL